MTCFPCILTSRASRRGRSLLGVSGLVDTSVVGWRARVFEAVYQTTKSAGATASLAPIAGRLGLDAADITTEALTADTGAGRAHERDATVWA